MIQKWDSGARMKKSELTENHLQYKHSFSLDIVVNRNKCLRKEVEVGVSRVFFHTPVLEIR